ASMHIETTARALSADRIRSVGTYYKMGRVRGEWGLVPRGAEVCDRLFVFKDFGALVLLREGGGWRGGRGTLSWGCVGWEGVLRGRCSWMSWTGRGSIFGRNEKRDV